MYALRTIGAHLLSDLLSALDPSSSLSTTMQLSQNLSTLEKIIPWKQNSWETISRAMNLITDVWWGSLASSDLTMQ
jgi:hypothetical protein